MRQPSKTSDPVQLETELEEIVHGLQAFDVQNSGLYGMPRAREEEIRQVILRGSQVVAQLKELGLLKNKLAKLADQFRQIILADRSNASAGDDEHLEQ